MTRTCGAQIGRIGDIINVDIHGIISSKKTTNPADESGSLWHHAAGRSSFLFSGSPDIDLAREPAFDKGPGGGNGGRGSAD